MQHGQADAVAARRFGRNRPMSACQALRETGHSAGAWRRRLCARCGRSGERYCFSEAVVRGGSGKWLGRVESGRSFSDQDRLASGDSAVADCRARKAQEWRWRPLFLDRIAGKIVIMATGDHRAALRDFPGERVLLASGRLERAPIAFPIEREAVGAPR